ncbi:tetratricopeptide repeat protein [Sinomonas sp. JGH33]|uniref:Tetratricopeptide repeat protein n=1 Tax=Sinomonas terricola TaxID=3110330 RepID=A0ABU5TBH3_9MICC|nr:tetratricopeptide repeat protein [Sinomonas sp. JGH33]MEA5457033.1 tetratricopeptide repeat protein [Sinomonas sp. JGH33]
MFSKLRALWTTQKALIAAARGDVPEVVRLGKLARELPPPRRLRPAATRASILMDLATGASRERDHRHAVALLREAERLFTSVGASTGRSRWVAEILLRLGGELRLAGRYTDACDALIRAEQLANTDAARPMRLASVFNAQGILAKDTGLYEAALARYEAARALMGAEFGEDHPALGAVLLGLGRLDEAEEAYLRSKTIWTARRGPGHHEVAVQLNGLATVSQARGDFDAAERDFWEALRIKQRVLGAEHREVAALLNNLGALEMDRGHPEAAARLYETALLTFRETLGDDHPDTRLCTENLARGRELTQPNQRMRWSS